MRRSHRLRSPLERQESKFRLGLGLLVVWVRLTGNTDPVNDNMADWTFQIGKRWIRLRLTYAKRQAYAASSGHASVDLTSNSPSCPHTTRYASQTRAIAGYGTPPML